MRILILLSFCLLFSGCCSTCIKDDVSFIVDSEKENFSGINYYLKDLYANEVESSRGLGEDLKNIFKSEKVDTKDTWRDFKDIMCPCP